MCQLLCGDNKNSNGGFVCSGEKKTQIKYLYGEHKHFALQW